LQWRKIVAMAHRRIGKGSASVGSTAQRATTERAIRERERKRESERTRREGGREVERGVGTK
jgi:hypothetical protein